MIDRLRREHRAMTDRLAAWIDASLAALPIDEQRERVRKEDAWTTREREVASEVLLSWVLAAGQGATADQER